MFSCRDPRVHCLWRLGLEPAVHEESARILPARHDVGARRVPPRIPARGARGGFFVGGQETAERGYRGEVVRPVRLATRATHPDETFRGMPTFDGVFLFFFFFSGRFLFPAQLFGVPWYGVYRAVHWSGQT